MNMDLIMYGYNQKHFIELFKQRISDCYVHKWRADIESNGVLNVFYMHIKSKFEI